MLTYTQDFSPYAIPSNPRADGDSKPEGKAAARRRRQMERQQRRQREPDRMLAAAPLLTQAAEQQALAIEQAQADHEASHIERILEPPPEPPKRVTQTQLVEWFNKWRKPIRSWFRGKASVPPGDIDDLAQEVFVRLLRYCDGVMIENPQGYLFRIASNVAAEWRERARNSKPHDAEWLDGLLLDEHEQPEEIYQHVLEGEVVQAAVEQLTPRQRMVLLAHINEGLTYKEIATRHGLTYRIVLRDLTRSYSILRGKLSPEMFGS